MLKMVGKRQSHRIVATGTDKVLFGIAMPSDSVVTSVQAEVHLTTREADVKSFENVCMWGCEGYVIPVDDPDTTEGYEALWDRYVPKDTDVEAIDLDTAAEDATPFLEPGEPDWTQVLDVGLRPRRVFRRQGLVSVVHPRAVLAFHDPNTPFAALWQPADFFRIRVNRPIRVSKPSMMLFALASPALDDTTTTLPITPAENEWSRTRYMGEVLRLAIMDLIGLTEAGATTPWEEATDLLLKHLLPDVVEETAGVMGSVSWDATTMATFHQMVPGTLGKNTLRMQ